MSMNAREWIEAGLDVLVDSEEDPCDADMQTMVEANGLEAMLSSLLKAADSAGDHLGEGNGGCDAGPADAETVAKIDRFRVAIREAIKAVKS